MQMSVGWSVGWSGDSLSRFSFSSKCSLDNRWIDLSNDADDEEEDDDDDEEEEEDDDEEDDDEDDDDEKMKFFKNHFFPLFTFFSLLYFFPHFFQFFSHFFDFFSRTLYSSRTLGMKKKYLLSIEGSIFS